MTRTALKTGLRLPEYPPVTLGQREIAAYLAASGDDNPLHSDAALARSAGFADILVPGMMVMGQMAEMLAAWPPCARVTDLRARFLAPVVAGTALTFGGRVVAMRDDGHAILRVTARAGQRVAIMAEAVIAPA